MALLRSRGDNGMNYWPGFVDALSTLILSIIFLLTVFMVAQFFLSQEASGKNTMLARLSAQISRLGELLSLEKTGKASLEEQVTQLRASLSAIEGESAGECFGEHLPVSQPVRRSHQGDRHFGGGVRS
jgi:chemotaxis protein MotB